MRQSFPGFRVLWTVVIFSAIGLAIEPQLRRLTFQRFPKWRDPTRAEYSTLTYITMAYTQVWGNTFTFALMAIWSGAQQRGARLRAAKFRVLAKLWVVIVVNWTTWVCIGIVLLSTSLVTSHAAAERLWSQMLTYGGIAYLVMGLGLLRLVRHREPAQTPAVPCEECGYDLVGLTSSVCPECGSPVIDQSKGEAATSNKALIRNRDQPPGGLNG